MTIRMMDVTIAAGIIQHIHPPHPAIRHSITHQITLRCTPPATHLATIGRIQYTHTHTPITTDTIATTQRIIHTLAIIIAATGATPQAIQCIPTIGIE